MDWRARHIGRQRRAAVANISGHIEKPAEHGVPDRYRDRTSARAHRHAAPKARGCLHRNPADCPLIEMGLNLDNQRSWSVPFYDKGFIESWQVGRLEGDVDHGPAHSDDLSSRLR